MMTAADRDPGRSMAELYRAVPNSFGSPTRSANCAGEIKDRVVGGAIAVFQAMFAAGQRPDGHALRCTLADGSWCLVRTSSNRPDIVVVVESPVSQERLHQMFALAGGVLRRRPDVGGDNQTL
jgi:phosphomannomutase / phosphoglucomutase